MKINKSAKQNPVDLLYLIASVIKFSSRKIKQELLEINNFDERISNLQQILKKEIEKGLEIKMQAEKLMAMNKD